MSSPRPTKRICADYGLFYAIYYAIFMRRCDFSCADAIFYAAMRCFMRLCDRICDAHKMRFWFSGHHPAWLSSYKISGNIISNLLEQEDCDLLNDDPATYTPLHNPNYQAILDLSA
jgi:hypothetical protein